MEVVRRVDEHAAHGRADQATVDVWRIRGGKLACPLRGDCATGVSDQCDLGVARESDGRRLERRADRIKGVLSVLWSGDEVGLLAFGVGDDDGVSSEQERQEERSLDRRKKSAKRDTARDRI